jgi:hypothetical protein
MTTTMEKIFDSAIAVAASSTSAFIRAEMDA